MLVRAKRYGMKTININGKEYTKGDFVKSCINAKIKESPLSLIFAELKQAFPQHEPKLPKLRPMSELPQDGYEFVFVIKEQFETGGVFNEIGRFKGDNIITDGHELYIKAKNYRVKGLNLEIIGWLYELPNPNDIKL